MRFVRRKGGSSGGGDKRLRSIFNVAFLVAIAVAFFTINFSVQAFKAARVDPDILQSLDAGKPVTAYVVATATINVRAEKVWRFGDALIYKVRLLSKQDLQRLLASPRVKSIWGERVFRHPTPSFSVASTTYNLTRDIKWEVHKRGAVWAGRGVTVAIIDTGIDYTHPDFYDADNNTIVKVFVSVLFVSAYTKQPIFWVVGVNGSIDDLYRFDMSLREQYNETAFLDLNGHGTHVAGIVAGRGWASNGRYRGLAPGAELVIIKAFNKDGTASMDLALDALQWVHDHHAEYGIKVLSLSWGAAMASDGSDPISVACDEIAERGVFVFAAAGNLGNFPTTVMIPAAARMVYAVGAWDGYTNKIAPFSAMGPTVDFRMKPDFLGAGVMVVSCKSQFVDFPDELEVDKYYVALTGTSMATPCVAAVCADFIEYYRYWHHRDPSREDWERFAQLNSIRLNPFFKDFISGWGIPQSP
ncbi:hypothetical protein DRO24_02375 [Candidatus Bathyarchaeota archaeon]|nr:MAG: hypothetical protein DRO24_02375 [Candidatus Bathyarchaeota archaeon]